MDENEVITKILGGGSGFIAGAIAGVIAMLYQKARSDKAFDEMEERLRGLETTHMPRSEIISLYREHRDETRQANKETQAKLDLVLTRLSEINVTLAGKADKK